MMPVYVLRCLFKQKQKLYSKPVWVFFLFSSGHYATYTHIQNLQITISSYARVFFTKRPKLLYVGIQKIVQLQQLIFRAAFVCLVENGLLNVVHSLSFSFIHFVSVNRIVLLLLFVCCLGVGKSRVYTNFINVNKKKTDNLKLIIQIL